MYKRRMCFFEEQCLCKIKSLDMFFWCLCDQAFRVSVVLLAVKYFLMNFQSVGRLKSRFRGSLAQG